MLRVVGVVQGVGFRPHVYTLATRLGLVGFVQNRTSEVWIEVEGDPAVLDQFPVGLTRSPPPLARIHHLRRASTLPLGESGFIIQPSLRDAGDPAEISSDIATCLDCLRELHDPADRRHGYPFINCTNCGPRFTIINDLPYDRERTTMAAFAMCSRCRAEYEDPTNRRFHAQPVACPDCGPTLRLCDRRGADLPGPPILELARRLAAGDIAAIKGIGGYHLACDAGRADVVQRLRARKHRDDKPFAVMVRDLAAAEALCDLDDATRALLTAPACPIVLAVRRAGVPIATGVAPETVLLGLLLPYTPVHHLLLAVVPGPLVMTSGNHSDEPIVHTDSDAFDHLADIADVFLVHDRPIATACEDSVVRVADGGPIVVRRAQGRPQFLQGVAFDITDVKRAQDVLVFEAVRNAKLEEDLVIARRVQTSIVPHTFAVPSLEIAARMQPADQVGGDYYDVIPFPGGCWLAIGDVAGHGLDSGLIMLMLQSALSGAVTAKPDARPSEVLRCVNQVLHENIRSRLGQDHHVTFSLLRYTDDGRIVVTGAHEDIIILRKGGKVESFTPPGTWLGVSLEIHAALQEMTLHLGEGDALVLYTDGITEAQDATRQLFDFKRLLQCLEKVRGGTSQAVCDHVFREVKSWMAAQRDDMTILVATRRPGASAVTT